MSKLYFIELDSQGERLRHGFVKKGHSLAQIDVGCRKIHLTPPLYISDDYCEPISIRAKTSLPYPKIGHSFHITTPRGLIIIVGGK